MFVHATDAHGETFISGLQVYWQLGFHYVYNIMHFSSVLHKYNWFIGIMQDI